MEKQEIKNILEALFFITDRPLSVNKLKDFFASQSVAADGINEVIQELRQGYAQRAGALCVSEVAGGYQIATKPEYGEWIRKLYKDRITYRMTKSSLETLSIIAYKQPVTRSEIEEIRGVDVSAILERLLERRLVRICGRKEVIGRPILYGTTPEFLKFFGLRDLSDIPDLDDLAAKVEAETEAEGTIPSVQSEEVKQEDGTAIPLAADNSEQKQNT